MTKRVIKNIISGAKVDEMIQKAENVRTEVIKEYDPWWGEKEVTNTYVTVDGIEYRKETTREGNEELWEVVEV